MQDTSVSPSPGGSKVADSAARDPPSRLESRNSNRQGGCSCCREGEAGSCRVACLHCAGSISRPVKRQVTKLAAPSVKEGDYPGWPGWNWKNDDKLREQFQQLQTGDLLLMCSTHPYGEWARALAKTKWDHVAMIVRHRPRVQAEVRCNEADFEKWPKCRKYHQPSSHERDRDYDFSEPSGDPLRDLEVFETTGQGCHVYTLLHRLRDDPEISKRYSRVAIRPVKVQRTEEMLESVEEFIASVRNTPFEQNQEELRQCIMRQKTAGEDLSTLFCAEMVAACYQKMGIMSQERSSNEFLPCDFSSENAKWGACLIGGAEWGPEEIIKAPGGWRDSLRRLSQRFSVQEANQVKEVKATASATE